MKRRTIILTAAASALIFTAGLAMILIQPYLPGTFRIDNDGSTHGTGINEIHYEVGSLMKREHYRAGKLTRAEWYKPDGTLILDTTFTNGEGEALFLREDGTIRVRQWFKDGIAHGPATHYDEQGNTERTAIFEGGVEVSETTEN